MKAHASRSDQLLNFDYERLERQLDVFLGPRPSQEDLRYLSFSFANFMAQLARGELLSPGSVTRNAPIAFSFYLRNAARTIDHLIAQCMHPSFANDDFTGMMDYVAKSFHYLLVGDSEVISDSNSNGGPITPRVNASSQALLRGTSKVSTMGGSLPQLALMTRLREMQDLAYEWSN
jgi:hypothetical protein